MADTPDGETATPAVPENNSGTPVAPAAGPTTDEAAELRKKAEQAQMRANQLQNEIEKRDKAQAEAERKRLEEEARYKDLYEKTDAELRSIREREEAESQQRELATLSQDVFKDYPANVQEIAKTAGIGLTDDSEVARTSLKEKLDAIAKRVTPEQVSTPNNPSNTPSPVNPTQDLAPELQPAEQELTGKGGRPVTAMAMAGARNDFSVVNKYISRLSAIEQMRKDSGYTRSVG